MAWYTIASAAMSAVSAMQQAKAGSDAADATAANAAAQGQTLLEQAWQSDAVAGGIDREAAATREQKAVEAISLEVTLDNLRRARDREQGDIVNTLASRGIDVSDTDIGGAPVQLLSDSLFEFTNAANIETFNSLNRQRSLEIEAGLQDYDAQIKRDQADQFRARAGTVRTNADRSGKASISTARAKALGGLVSSGLRLASGSGAGAAGGSSQFGQQIPVSGPGVM